ncbi:hypothetical protein ASE92_11400 [Pedobacter sp. Leaf41]|jgi:hypothetical protein|uniref:hypothetical protein n=1 Tax=Pedobacter sp. Leaf41 TaxID=1736218 RepID=UPI000702AEE2|nr:hypothetical protein [Pedobacter sp. Leaf41]KQN35217.1 hypothetical protein ASE92_11400 [Pedobacter sp. Leaf41]RZK64496.1 MAG: hypothetical protein EOO95_10875 [Pedobacter sp.]
MEREIIGKDHVPVHQSGAETDAVENVEFESEQEATAFYQVVKHRLSDVNNWGSLSSIPLSSFKLFDHAGRACDREVEEGDYIRIDIPGPGTRLGKGYDWVHVEAVFSEVDFDQDIFTIRVRPSSHPLEPDGKIAHFLTSRATSTFQIKRIKNFVYAEEHARNESPNFETGNGLDNFRNAIVGTAARIGFSYPQWKSLVKGLLKSN